MLRGIFKRKAQKQVVRQIELQINDLQLYLENNYKDLAIQAKKDAIVLLETCYTKGEIDAKTYSKYKVILDDYTQNMEGYNHQQFYHS